MKLNRKLKIKDIWLRLAKIKKISITNTLVVCLGFKPGVAGWSKTRIYGGHRPKQVWNKLAKVSFALTESSLEIWCFLDVNKIVKNRSLFRLRKQTWRLGRVWPDLANFHHFGEIFNCLAYLKGLFSILNSTFGKTFLTFEKKLLVQMAKCWKIA